MYNRPFFSTNTNIFDETLTSSKPAYFNGQNVLMTQENQRKCLDIMNTSISGPPKQQYVSQMNPCCVQSNVLPAQKIVVPGGAEFVFNQQPSIIPLQQTCPMIQTPPCPCPGPSHSFPIYPEQHTYPRFSSTSPPAHPYQNFLGTQACCCSPFQLKFHKNMGTTCDDLLRGPSQVPGSGATPDFSNINGIPQCPQRVAQTVGIPGEQNQLPPNESLKALMNELKASCEAQVERIAKQLILSKPVVKEEFHVADLVDTPQEQPRVKFDNDPSSFDKKCADAKFPCLCTIEEKDEEKQSVSEQSKSDDDNISDDNISDDSNKNSSRSTKKPKKKYSNKKKRKSSSRDKGNSSSDDSLDSC